MVRGTLLLKLTSGKDNVDKEHWTVEIRNLQYRQLNVKAKMPISNRRPRTRDFEKMMSADSSTAWRRSLQPVVNV